MKKFLLAGKVISAIIFGLGILSLISLPLLDRIVTEMAFNSMHRYQTVAENIEVTSDWFEIKPKKPLEATKIGQEIRLLINGYEYDLYKNDFGNIQLKNGNYINPKIEIVDQNGKTYELEDSSRNGEYIGFSLKESILGIDDFPDGVKFTVVRIRSDDPFLCNEIVWHDYDMK